MPDLSHWSNADLLNFIRSPAPIPQMAGSGANPGPQSAVIPTTYATLGDVSQAQARRAADAALAARGGLAGVVGGQSSPQMPAPGSFVVGNDFGGVQGAEQSATNADRSYQLALIAAAQRDREQAQRESEAAANANYRERALDESLLQNDTRHNEFLANLDFLKTKNGDNTKETSNMGTAFADALAQANESTSKAEADYTRAQQDKLKTDSIVTQLLSKRLITPNKGGGYTGAPGYEDTAANVAKTLEQRNNDLKNTLSAVQIARQKTHEVQSAAGSKGFRQIGDQVQDIYTGKSFDVKLPATTTKLTYDPNNRTFIPRK